jgi:hypothetical protein
MSRPRRGKSCTHTEQTGETMRGDLLASGAARSAQFPSMSHVSQSRWDDIFGKRPLNIAKPTKKKKKDVQPNN